MSQTTSKRSSSPSSSSTSTLTSSASSEATSSSSSSNALATRASSTSSSTKTSPSQVGGWLAEKIHDSFLTCRLCFEAYTSPKCLSCLHTFCEGCIENLLHESDLLLAYRKYSTTDYREVVCPICRKRTQVPLGGVRRLPDNFLVEGLSETLVRQKPPKFPLCDICKLVNKKDKDASSKCLECQRMMCQDCLVLHGQTRVTSGHTIFDVEIEKEIECKDHEDEIVRFYCDTCSSCICIMCTFNEHREHEIIGFQEAASKHQGRVKNMADICKKHLIGSERELEALESCESLITSVEQFIKHKAEEMLTEIKYREKHLIDQLKKIYGKQCLDRIAKKKELILKMEESKSACKLVDAILAGKEIEFLLLRNKVEEKLETLNKTPRKKLPSTVGKAVEFRPGSLNFGYLYDYDEPKSVNKNNSTATTENEDKTKRRSKTAIEINYVTAFYGGGQIHTCSVDTQTDPADFKKIGEPSKTKKTQTVDVSKKKNNETTNSVAETNEPTTATTTVTPATSNPDTTPPINLPATTNITTTTTTTNTAEATTSNQQQTASSLAQQQEEHKTTQNEATVRPSSSSASSSSSSSSSQIQRNSDKDTQNKLSQQQNTSTDRPKLRRILKHIGSSVESFSSYDDDVNVFTQDETQFCNPLSKIETETKMKLSSLSSISSSSPKQSLSSPSYLLSRNANVAIVPSLITSIVPPTVSSVTSQKSSPTMSSDTNLEEKIMDSKTSPSVSLTSKNAPPASTNVATIPKSVATTIQNSATTPKSVTTTSQKSVTTQQSPSKTTTTQSFATSPRNVVTTTNNIPSKVQQVSLSMSTSNILKPALSTSSSSSSAPATPKPLPQVTSSSSSSSSSSLNQGLVSTPANTINVNSIAHKMETKLQPVQQPAVKNQVKTMPLVLKSSPSSSSVVTSSLQAASSLTLPPSVLSSPLLSKSPSTSQSAVPHSVASSSSAATRPTALSSSTVRVPQQTNSPITNVVSATSTNCVISPVLNSPVSSSSASLIQTSPSRSQAIAITTQMTPTGGSKIVATIAPTMTSAIKTASSSSSSMTSLPANIKTDPPSKNDSETTELPKDKPSQPSTTQTTTTTQSSTTSIATPSNDSGRVVYRKKPKEMTHLSDSPIFKHPYSFVEAGSQKGGAYPSRHAPPLYNQPSSYLRHSHVPHTSSSGSPASHRMSDGSLYGQHKFY